jgi:prepilin-type N-terminal cleavage/methylation domain-containing protein
MNKKGFILMELLVVITIIGLLSTLAVVVFHSAKAKSYASKCKSGDLESCKILKEKFSDFKDEDGTKAEDIKPIKKDSISCDKQKTDCRYNCAENTNDNLDDCLLRCDIKSEKCLSK